MAFDQHPNPGQFGSLQVVSGPMFAGKSEELMRRLRRATFADRPVYLFKPVRDTRDTVVHSHDGRRMDADIVESIDEALSRVHMQGAWIGFDETQFFADEPSWGKVFRLVENGCHLIFAGLTTDQTGAPFGIMPSLLARATHHQILTSICSVCKGPALRSMWVHDEPYSEENCVGAEDKYEPRCPSHFVPYDEQIFEPKELHGAVATNN